jgi:hypothetical protein
MTLAPIGFVESCSLLREQQVNVENEWSECEKV